MYWEKVRVGNKVVVSLPGDQHEVGTVLEVGGRLLKNGSVDPGWIRVTLDDGREFPFSEAQIDSIV